MQSNEIRARRTVVLGCQTCVADRPVITEKLAACRANRLGSGRRERLGDALVALTMVVSTYVEVGMRLAPYALATLIGIIPGTLVFASIGAGIGGVLEAGRQRGGRLRRSTSWPAPASSVGHSWAE